MDADQGDIDGAQKEEKRPTVNVSCGVPNGIQMRIYDQHEGLMGTKMSVPIGDTVVLKGGGNPGIDKAFFDRWLEENAKLSIVEQGLITATDEEDPDEAE